LSLTAVATARAGVLEHQTLKGKALDAEFTTSTPETCADGSSGSVDVLVVVDGEEAFESSRINGKTLINAVSVFVAVTDSCAGTTSIAAGAVSGGFDAISPRKATVQATVPLTDESTGAPAGTLVAALTLQGGSIISMSNETDKIVFPDDSFRTDQIKATSRPATPSGSVTVNGVEFVHNLSIATLFDNRDSVTDIAR
jgi:hypothetical protein